ncbi:hypothetical protein EV129_1211, partial [Rhizobium azibense]
TTMKNPVVVDLRNIYPVAEITRHGFSHFAVGKKTE